MKRPHLLDLCLLTALLALAACSNNEDSVTTPEEDLHISQRLVDLMGGYPHMDAIRTTGKATAFRIGKDDAFNEVVLGEGIVLTDEQRQALSSLLVHDHSYDWDIAKGCEPMPGVLITFEDGATVARVRLCFSCRMVGYTPGGWEDFDPVTDELVQWVKDVFPDDEVVQALGTPEQTDGL